MRPAKATILCLFQIFAIVPKYVYSKPKNNACKDYKSYQNIHYSPNCYYIPDNNKNVSQIIEHHLGLSETHQIPTEDGYILTLFRIPQRIPKRVILLHHGIVTDARSWVAQNNDSIAFLFWRDGYDVWLGNFRGTYYSKKHKSLLPTDEEFWNFSFHEMGIYDITAMVQYIRKITSAPKIVNLGFSLSGSASLVYAALKPKESSNSVEIFVNLAPAVYFNHVTSPVMYTLFPLIHHFLKANLHRSLHWFSFANNDAWYIKLYRTFSNLLPFKRNVAYTLSLLFGWTPDEIDPSYINLAIDQIGSASSLKTFDHQYQNFLSKNYKMYDYGEEDNLQIYGTKEPPIYPLQNVQVPVFTIYSKDDSLADPNDIELLYQNLPSRAKIFGTKMIEGMNHHDFLFGKSRNVKVYYKILQLLDALLLAERK